MIYKVKMFCENLPIRIEADSFEIDLFMQKYFFYKGKGAQKELVSVVNVNDVIYVRRTEKCTDTNEMKQ